MKHEGVGPGVRPVTVRVPVEPVEAAVEADARDAAVRGDRLAVRGPLFGVAAQGAGDGACWRVVVEVMHGYPQQARDSLNSRLWFRAKDEAKNRVERRALLDAVTRLETEPVDDLTVLGTRYRVVRAEEYMAMDAHGGTEMPRATDPEPLTPDWSRRSRHAKVDDGLLLDPDAPLSPLAAVERLSLRTLAYTGARFPADVLAESAHAVESHPDVLLMPVAFRIVERSGDEPWTPGGGLMATAHDARRLLDFDLVWWRPREQGLIPQHAETIDGVSVDARTLLAESTDPAAGELAVFAEAADRLRTEHLNEVVVQGRTSRICRARRLLRWGPDGPEGPRPSDSSGDHAPAVLHPRLDEDGTIHFDEEPAEDDDAAS
ncbi:DUF5954 family protein [Streptomyces luteolus]|uniref:DUF5954 family protein n=1 Tax=Streptomyces luteolus TaxID=3043615 RepID=A0ABT6T7G8_9ACTN|nr:DUF5954 family protein [Streptomyces sp. B-S-A12]MDI3423843.1 DUF5954 family protein [Streptomyces sp. B-S-A12]